MPGEPPQPLGPYRRPDAPSERPPSQLVYVSVDREGAGKPSFALLQMFAVPLIAGAIGSVTVSPTVGLVALLGSAFLLAAWWRGQKKGKNVVLDVDDGVVVFTTKGKSTRIRLADLATVALDTKTIQRVVDGASAIPAMRFIDSRVAPEVDLARVVLVTSEGETTPLEEAYGAHMDAVEWLGKIRVFLRKNGWVPEDERDDV